MVTSAPESCASTAGAGSLSLQADAAARHISKSAVDSRVRPRGLRDSAWKTTSFSSTLHGEISLPARVCAPRDDAGAMDLGADEDFGGTRHLRRLVRCPSMSAKQTPGAPRRLSYGRNSHLQSRSRTNLRKPKIFLQPPTCAPTAPRSDSLRPTPSTIPPSAQPSPVSSSDFAGAFLCFHAPHSFTNLTNHGSGVANRPIHIRCIVYQAGHLPRHVSASLNAHVDSASLHAMGNTTLFWGLIHERNAPTTFNEIEHRTHRYCHLADA